MTLHAASDVLSRYSTRLPSKYRSVLLRHLQQVRPENIGTLQNIDNGIATLLDGDDVEQGLRFLEDLLGIHGNNLIIESSARVILKSPKLLYS